jgi:hypothetical protein
MTPGVPINGHFRFCTSPDVEPGQTELGGGRLGPHPQKLTLLRRQKQRLTSTITELHAPDEDGNDRAAGCRGYEHSWEGGRAQDRRLAPF